MELHEPIDLRPGQVAAGLIFCIFLLFPGFNHRLMAQQFISVRDGRFYLNDQPYYFLGTNFWYGFNLGASEMGRQRLLAELDELHSLGVANLRIMAATEGPDTEPWRVSPALQPEPGVYDESLLQGLDFLLAEMARRDMKAVLCLSNFWQWSGGFAQYVAWSEGKAVPYPPPAEGGNWMGFSTWSSRFYKDKAAMELYDNLVRKLIGRTNSVTGMPYREDPAIMAWELANEPRGILRAGAYRRWVRHAAGLIKSLDPNHLVTIGSEGNTNFPTGNHFKRDHRPKDIDYTTVHIWIQNWQWYDPLKPEESYDHALEKAKYYLEKHLKWAEKLDKPLVLEEFGIARDADDHDPLSPTAWRDRYYREMFSTVHELAASGRKISGCNFWAWGGKGRPRIPKGFWQPGDDLIGDPPHEAQGWYSVYDRDASTLAIIREFAARMGGVRN